MVTLLETSMPIRRLLFGCATTVFGIFFLHASSGERLAASDLNEAEPILQRHDEKEPFTAWGQEIGGLQAGLGFHHGCKKAYRVGDSVKAVVRVRNVGKKEVTFQHLRHFFIEHPPVVLAPDGKPVDFKDGAARGIYVPLTVTLEPGRDVDLYELNIAILAKGIAAPPESSIVGVGKFRVRYDRIFGETMLSSTPLKIDAELRKLATGTLEIEVQSPGR
ncbi:MAG: hypothetical protein U0744_21945 [Gemmataceae bacterium]